MSDNKSSANQAGATPRNQASLDVMLKGVADTEAFMKHPEVMAIAYYCRARYGVTPYQKDPSWKPLMRFKLRVGDKETGEVSITVFYPKGNEYPYTRFGLVFARTSGINQRYMPLTLDQTISLIQDFQDPYSGHNRITNAEKVEDTEA